MTKEYLIPYIIMSIISFDLFYSFKRKTRNKRLSILFSWICYAATLFVISFKIEDDFVGLLTLSAIQLIVGVTPYLISELIISLRKIKLYKKSEDMVTLVASLLPLSFFLSLIVFSVLYVSEGINILIKINNDQVWKIALGIMPSLSIFFYGWKLFLSSKNTKIEDIATENAKRDKSFEYKLKFLLYFIFTALLSIGLSMVPEKPFYDHAINNLKLKDEVTEIPIDKKGKTNEEVLREMVVASQDGKILLMYMNNRIESTQEIKIIDESKLSVVMNENVTSDHLELSSKAILKDPNYDYLKLGKYNRKDASYKKEIKEIMESVEEPKYTIYLKK